MRESIWFRVGRTAYNNGTKRQENPYAPSTVAFKDWFEGWDDTEKLAPLAPWELDLLNACRANVVFTLDDGNTLTIENVRVDSVGPSAENKGVIGVEFHGSDRLVHVPFVRSWEFTYN